MKKLFLSITFLSIAYLMFAQSINIIPQPTSVVQKNGTFTLSSNSSITYNKAELTSTAELCSQKLSTPTGFKVKTKQGIDGTITLNILEQPNASIGKEGYLLDVTANNISIKANTQAGIYYGFQTLLQLFPKDIESKKETKSTWTAPCVSITDSPRFGWRGIMLDVSRHFFTKEEVKQYIDEISKYKYNVFHWHLTDDNGWRIEIKSLPKLTEIGAWRMPLKGHFGERIAPQTPIKPTEGGFYTQSDIKEIIQYASTRNVTIIPEIDVPGHSMAALAAYPELSCTKDTSTIVDPGLKFAEWYGNGTFKVFKDNTLNPSDEKVYEFLDKVFTEVAALFPSPYIHVGGDECYKGFWKKDPGCQALMKKLNIRHVEDLQGYFMNRLEKILSSKGKKLLGWDEILEGGIAPGATVMSWQGIKGGIEAAKLGHDVVMSPTTHVYLDYAQGEKSIEPPIYANLRITKCYSFEPIPDGVDPKYILGGQGNVWTEQIPTLRHAQYMTYPRAWALSEVYWSNKESKNWAQFSKRMEAHFQRADVAQINYSKAVYDPIITASTSADGKLVLKMEAEATDLDIYYTINDAMPDNFCSKYTKPLEIPEGPITLRVITYRGSTPMGHLITLSRAELEKRTE